MTRRYIKPSRTAETGRLRHDELDQGSQHSRSPRTVVGVAICHSKAEGALPKLRFANATAAYLTCFAQRAAWSSKGWSRVTARAEATARSTGLR